MNNSRDGSPLQEVFNYQRNYSRDTGVPEALSLKCVKQSTDALYADKHAFLQVSEDSHSLNYAENNDRSEMGFLYAVTSR